MSHIKHTVNQFISITNLIQKETIDDNDLTNIFNDLNVVIEISERIRLKDTEINFYWNEIISELIAVIYSSISGHNRLSTTGLRNILELSCHAFFYYDHKIELRLSINENEKADKYVSSLIRDFDFFTTKYIKTFYDKISDLESKPDSISDFLKIEYGKLCDVVHGRHASLTKQSILEIKYSKSDFKKFENHFQNVVSLISIMYIIRFDDFTDLSIINAAKKNNLIILKHE